MNTETEERAPYGKVRRIARFFYDLRSGNESLASMIDEGRYVSPTGGAVGEPGPGAARFANGGIG